MLTNKLDLINLIIGIVIGIIIGYLIAKLYFWINMRKLRKQSVDKSKSVILGQVNEQLAPLLPDFPYNYKDATFIGKGIDYIIFDGLNEGNLRKVVFLEVKSGQSNLNRNEKMIKNVIDGRKIIYEIFKI